MHDRLRLVLIFNLSLPLSAGSVPATCFLFLTHVPTFSPLLTLLSLSCRWRRWQQAWHERRSSNGHRCSDRYVSRQAFAKLLGGRNLSSQHHLACSSLHVVECDRCQSRAGSSALFLAGYRNNRSHNPRAALTLELTSSNPPFTAEPRSAYLHGDLSLTTLRT